MKKSRIGVALAATIWLIGVDLTGFAKPGASGLPTGPSEESKALGAFFSTGMKWTGRVSPGALGPGTAESPSRGEAICRELYGGFWYACDIRDVIGEDAITWEGHMMVGYDSALNTYRALIVDDRGAITLFEGELEGARFSLETPEPVMILGEMTRHRLSWARREDGTTLFTDQRQRGEDEEWTLFQTAVIEPRGN